MTQLENQELEAALQVGRIELNGQFLPGSNYTFLVTVHAGEESVPAVYKPTRGEQPLWDFPVNSLAGREVAAYLVSEALGFGFVPFTVLRDDGPFGPGSLQQFIDYNPGYHYFTFRPDDRERLRPVALFDLLTNNADRKGSHLLIQKRTRRLFTIDHGLCFHASDKLRTVIWDFAGQVIPDELLTAVENLRASLTGTSSLRGALQPYLIVEELTALESRAAALLARREFPLPPEDRRSFPYPPL